MAHEAQLITDGHVRSVGQVLAYHNVVGIDQQFDQWRTWWVESQHLTVKGVLVLTTYDDDEWVFDAIRAGAAGYLLKDTPREALIQAVRGTVEGKSFVDPAVAGKLLGQVAGQQVRPSTLITGKLTGREVDVLRLLARGFSNADIADRLYLSEGTVRNHVSAILAKLEVSDRTQAAVIAIQHGLGNE
jgi:DNA-binding NarL/FixJ family response regulator